MLMMNAYEIYPVESRPTSPGPTACDEIALSFREWIDENWFTSTSLRDYAEQQPKSLKTIARRFTRTYGVSPKQYQLNKRLNEAKALLRESTWSLTDIAYECGFYDAAQFSRLFKTACDITPSTYRSIYTRTNAQDVGPGSQ
jgi:AraC-type DNA-binding domain-containing proteins